MARSATYLDPRQLERCTECGDTVEMCQCIRPDDIAHERLTSPDGMVIRLIRSELAAAREEFPNNVHRLAALVEEAGELAQALMQHDTDGSQTIQMVLREAVQTAAMAIRVATEGDADFSYVFPTVEEALPRGRVQDPR